MTDLIQMPVAQQDGSIVLVDTIAGNRSHVGNLIAEGEIAPGQREDQIVRLYEGQVSAKARRIVGLHQEIFDLRRKLRAAGVDLP